MNQRSDLPLRAMLSLYLRLRFRFGFFWLWANLESVPHDAVEIVAGHS
jgi:hypothetical protein